MLILTEGIKDWRDLQDKVADLFREMGYIVLSPHIVDLVRGKKEIDVYVNDPRTSVPNIILIECKHWTSPVKQETVHGFQTVMRDCDANTGIIVSSGGFQSGAAEAAASSNIELKTWESLQTSYGNEWYLRQREKLLELNYKLNQFDQTYLDQWETPKSIMNLMRFEHLGRTSELYHLLNQGRVLIFAMMAGPRSYDQPGPIETSVSENWPGAVKNKHDLPVVIHNDVRAWFQWIAGSAASLITHIEEFQAETFNNFESLSDEEIDQAFKKTQNIIRQETPVRVLQSLIEKQEYDRLLNLLQSNALKL